MRIRDVNVSSSCMTDKTMGKFYSVAAFVEHSSRKDRGLNVGHFMENETYSYIISVLKNKPNKLIVTAR